VPFRDDVSFQNAEAHRRAANGHTKKLASLVFCCASA